MGIRLFYDRWPQYNRRMVEVFGAMTPDQLAIQPAPDLLPIWAAVGHTAAMRVYWLGNVLKEPGSESTPFGDPELTVDWADDLDHPRTGEELATALETTFAIVEGCLDRWTPGTLEEVVERFYGDQRQLHTRGSILQRLLTHEAWHAGELSQTLGIHKLPQVDLWRPE